MQTPTLARRIFLWFVFVFLVAALPPLAHWLISFQHEGSTSVTELLAEGDGYLIAVAITADAIGRGLQQQKVPVFPIVVCCVVLAFALLGFGDTRTGLVAHKAAVDSAKVEDVKSLEILQSIVESGKPLQLADLKKSVADQSRLVDALDKRAEGETSRSRVVLVSEVAVCFGLIASFMIVLRG